MKVVEEDEDEDEEEPKIDFFIVGSYKELVTLFSLMG